MYNLYLKNFWMNVGKRRAMPQCLHRYKSYELINHLMVIKYLMAILIILLTRRICPV